MSPVHHCPSCGLAFRNKTELEYHWSEEHDPALRAPAVVEVEVEEDEQRGKGS
jgi:hypothetical protein